MESPPPSDTGRPAIPIRHNQPNTPPSTHYIRPEQVARKMEVNSIFSKLNLSGDQELHPRVRATLMYLAEGRN